MVRPAPNTLTNFQDIMAALVSLEEEEKELSNALSGDVADTTFAQRFFKEMESLSPQLEQVHASAEHLADRIGATARTAERVGGRVRLLDEEMCRVREAVERVSQVMELKESLIDLNVAIEIRDWERATRLCARTMSVPIEIVTGPFTEKVVPTEDLPSSPSQTIQAFRQQLRDIFLRQFQHASTTRNAAETTRFFKLFPAIGCEQEGLEAYASFVLSLVQTRLPSSAKTSSPLYYVTALTALFESVCGIIDQHQPIVEKYYGAGRMQMVLGYLMRECDKTVRRLLDSWEEERGVKRKLAEVTSTIPLRSPQPATRKQGTQLDPDETATIAREIDKLLNEISAMTMRFAAFRRFISSNAQERLLVDQSFSDFRDSANISDKMLQVVESSEGSTLFNELLEKYDVPLESWYFRYAINQAHRSSSSDFSQVPLSTSAPDLVFYILKSVITRVLNTGSVITVQNSSKQLVDAMEQDYAAFYRRKLDEAGHSASLIMSSTSRSDKIEKEARLNFIILLNDIDISSVHIEQLIKELVSSQLLKQNFLTWELTPIESSLNSMLSLAPRLRSILKNGLDQFFNHLLRPRLRTLVPDLYRDVSYVLDDDAYTTSEYRDIVRKRFLKAWESLLEDLKEFMTETNYRVFIGLVIDSLMRPWEKYIMTLKFSELGAIRFDRDIRAILTYLSSQVPFSDVRDKFQRLQQISTLLNIDKDEDVEEFYSSSGITWKLSISDARAVAALKT